MSNVQAPFSLSRQQLVQFHEQGYLVAENVFDDADLQPVIDEIQAEADRLSAELVAQGNVSRTFREAGFERQLTHITRETDAVALGVWSGQLCGPAFFNLIRNEKLLDIAETLCGPELIASSVYRLRPKVPGHKNSAVPWHQ